MARARGACGLLSLAAVFALGAARGRAVEWQDVDPNSPQERRSVSWWWDGRTKAGVQANASALLAFVAVHADLFDSVAMACGVGVMDNGTIGGRFEAACAEAAAGLSELGVSPELWTEETDSLDAAHALFAAPAEAADALVAVVKAHNLRGVNFDLECGGATGEDAAAYSKFLAAIRAPLADAGARLTVDASESSINGVSAELSGSVDRVMWMHSYYGASEQAWYYRLAPALDSTALPREQMAGGLAVYEDSRTAGWADTLESVQYRLCWMANLSVPEVALFRIDAAYGWPGERWIQPLKAYASGAACDPGPVPVPCPPPFTEYDADSCCTLHYSQQCDRQCAEAACDALPGWRWKVVNWTHSPYTCCPDADTRDAGAGGESTDGVLSTDGVRPAVDVSVSLVDAARDAGWVAGVASRVSRLTLEQARALMGVRSPSAAAGSQTESRALPMPRAALRTQPAPSDDNLPTSYDFRDATNCTQPIRDQLKCGSCWAESAVEVLGQRACVASGASAPTPQLSSMYLIACDRKCDFPEITHCSHGCQGGWPRVAWKYLVSDGVPLESCVSYNLSHQLLCPLFCDSNATHKGEYIDAKKRHKAASRYELESWFAIKEDLLAYGPVQAVFTVYQDFLAYQGGVYRHVAGDKVGEHAVSIVGWGANATTGEEWALAQNSWSTDWGENGYFRIVVGEGGIGYSALAGKAESMLGTA